jgi:hypothetical protein
MTTSPGITRSRAAARAMIFSVSVAACFNGRGYFDPPQRQPGGSPLA